MTELLHMIGLCPDSFSHIDLIDVMINLQTTGYHSSKIISGGLIIFCLASFLMIGFL